MSLHALRRGRLSDGETVDVALTEAVFSVMESLMPEYSAYGVVRGRTGNEMPGVAPSNTYVCGDGEWVVIGGNADGIFRRLMLAIERPDLADDGRMRDNRGRAKHCALLDEAIGGWTSGRPLAEVLRVLVAASVPVGPIYSVANIAEDNHFQQRDMLLDMTVEVEPGEPAQVTFPGIVPKFDQLPGRVTWLGPELGEHTDQVLSELLSLTEAEIAALRAGKVV